MQNPYEEESPDFKMKIRSSMSLRGGQKESKRKFLITKIESSQYESLPQNAIATKEQSRIIHRNQMLSFPARMKKRNIYSVKTDSSDH